MQQPIEKSIFLKIMINYIDFAGIENSINSMKLFNVEVLYINNHQKKFKDLYSIL